MKMMLTRQKTAKTGSVFRLFMTLVCVLMFVFSLVMTGCGKSDNPVIDDGTYLYYRSADGLGASRVPYEIEEEEAKTAIGKCLKLLAEDPGQPDTMELLPKSITVNGSKFRRSDGVVTLDFSGMYRTMDPITEVLVRSGYVRTLVQIPGVKYVEFTVEGQALTDKNGEVFGLMDGDDFIENAGKSVNAYQNAQITLYFGSEDGGYLVTEGRSIYYSSNKPLEWAVLERVIAGPRVAGHTQLVPMDTQILSVATQEKVCYVNLSSAFMQVPSGIEPSVVVYSIVNSIIRNCDVEKVQISVDGVHDILYGEKMDLSVFYEMNSDIVYN